jgi:hypothetical protein
VTTPTATETRRAG